MKKSVYVLTFLGLFLLIGLLVLAFTNPDRAAHCQLIKKEVMSAVSREMLRNPLLEEFAPQGTLIALNVVDEYMARNLVVRDYTFFSVGIVVFNGTAIPVTAGALNQVWILADKDDLDRALKSSGIWKQIEKNGFDDVIKLIERIR